MRESRKIGRESLESLKAHQAPCTVPSLTLWIHSGRGGKRLPYAYGNLICGEKKWRSILICCLSSFWLKPVAFLFAFYCKGNICTKMIFLCLVFLLSSFNKISKIVHARWLAERSVCIRVCKHGCDVKTFNFSRAHHASTNLKKVFVLKTWQVYFFYPFTGRLKLGKSFQNILCQFFSPLAGILSEKNPYFRKLLFCKTETDYARKTSCTRLRDWWEFIF